MNTTRVNIYISAVADRPDHFIVGVYSGDLCSDITKTFADQPAAEHYAAGVAAGLRACGRSCEVVIDVTEEPTASEDDADLLDFGSFDAWAQEREGRTVAEPEADPVERRLAFHPTPARHSMRSTPSTMPRGWSTGAASSSAGGDPRAATSVACSTRRISARRCALVWLVVPGPASIACMARPTPTSARPCRR